MNLVRIHKLLVLSAVIAALALWSAMCFADQPATGPLWDPLQPHDGCCNTVPNFGILIDFNVILDDMGLPFLAGHQIDNRLMSLCVYFAPVTFPPAPGLPIVEVTTDASRPPGCDLVASGLPHFGGNETMQFTPGGGAKHCVSMVGASIGFCNAIGTCWIEAFDACGNSLVGKVRNTVIGFEFLSIVMPEKVIHYVVWGDDGDVAGSAINCITYDSCVPCGPSATESTHWGAIKSLYN